MPQGAVAPVATWLRKVLDTLVEDFDLFGALIVGAFLLIAHYFHMIEDQKGLPAAMLTVLLAIVLISFRQRRKIEEMKHEIDSLGNLQSTTAQLVAQTAEEPGVHWYLKRSDAEEDMLKDSISSNRNVFIGISQTSLTTYFERILQNLTNPTILPWKTIEIYFASPELGALYEQSKFEVNVRRARQDIAACLTSPTYSLMLRAFEGVEFRQAKRPFDHSGSMFGSIFGDAPLEVEFSSIYIVHSRLYATELKDGITTSLRVTPARATSSLHIARMRHYINAYRSLRRDNRLLGTFRRTIWDESAIHWSEFATQSRILSRSMEHLVEVAELKRDETVLELGAGSGETSRRLVEKVDRGLVTLLDASPQMVIRARRLFMEMSHVNVALCELPEYDLDHIELRNRPYSTIIIHQSFQDLAHAFDNNLRRLANWCSERPTPERSYDHCRP